MINTVYKKLFNTVIAHNFYVDNISRKDLAVVPTQETMQVMKNGNMIFRTSADGFRVFYRADDDGSSFVDFSNLRLVFAVQLENIAAFLNFTNLDGTNPYKAGKIIYFTNAVNVLANELTYKLLDSLRPAMFTYQFPKTLVTGTVGKLVITGPDNTVVTPTYPNPDAIPKTSAGTFVYPISFTGMQKGIYKFETFIDGTPNAIELIYIDNELAKQNVFGIVDIKVINANDSSFPPEPSPPFPPSPPLPLVTASRVYTMRFVRRVTQWRYIVVLKSPSISPLDTIGIVDGEPTQEPYLHLLFTAPPVSTTVNGFPAKIFNSNSLTIPYFETPKKNLNIKKDPGLGVMVLKNIPGPPLGVVSADPGNVNITEIYVYI
ncbi:MAG: hypothetical protein JWO09_2798 [Bacteroidetes bacterium]|nr:hypothetical protein [Bacteroidota bacterium]